MWFLDLCLPKADRQTDLYIWDEFQFCVGKIELEMLLQG